MVSQSKEVSPKSGLIVLSLTDRFQCLDYLHGHLQHGMMKYHSNDISTQ